jgi:ethanolamine utilization protein EutQ (cupin superfamily)
VSDHHPHDEVTFVLEGELHIRVGDTTVVGTAGTRSLCLAGSTGQYWAPKYARMLGVYGPTPDGVASECLGYWEIDEEG